VLKVTSGVVYFVPIIDWFVETVLAFGAVNSKVNVQEQMEAWGAVIFQGHASRVP
jgi:hypothetical protein